MMLTNLLASDVSAVDDFLKIASKLSVVSILIFVVYGGWKKWWVFSWVYVDLLDRHEKLRKERDEWKAIALRSTNLVETMQSIQIRGD